jgi:hypothetical protein
MAHPQCRGKLGLTVWIGPVFPGCGDRTAPLDPLGNRAVDKPDSRAVVGANFGSKIYKGTAHLATR